MPHGTMLLSKIDDKVFDIRGMHQLKTMKIICCKVPLLTTISVLLLTLYSVFPVIAGELLSDNDIRRSLLGEWMVTVDMPTVRMTAVNRYTEDNVLHSNGTLQIVNTIFDFNIIAEYHIENGLFITEIKESDVPGLLPIGDRVGYKIIAIDSEQFTCLGETGIEYNEYRYPSETTEQNTYTKPIVTDKQSGETLSQAINTNAKEAVLFGAVERGDLAIVKTCLENGADVNVRDKLLFPWTEKFII